MIGGNTKLKSMVCPHCGAVNNYWLEKKGPHTQLNCGACDKYIKFISQRELRELEKSIKTMPVVQPVTNNMATGALMLTGSLCLTDIVEQAQKGHSAFSRGKNGKVYFNFLQWVNEEEDQYKNHSSIQLNSAKDKKDAEGKIYIGNAKKQSGGGEPLTPTDAAAITAPLANLPF